MSIVDLKLAAEECDIDYAEIVSYNVDPRAQGARFTFDLPFRDWRKRNFWNRFGDLFPSFRKPETRLLTVALRNITIQVDDFLQQFSNSDSAGHLEIERLAFSGAEGILKMDLTCEGKDLQLRGKLMSADEIPRFLTKDELASNKT